MDLPITYPEFEGQQLALRTGGFFQGAKILLNGTPAKKEKGVYVVQSNTGAEVPITLKRTFIDPIPKLVIGSEEIHLARPLTWYEYAWIFLPVMLVFAGGALGAVLGLLATQGSARVFRSEQPTGLKFLITGLISLAAVGVFVAGAFGIQMILTNARPS